MANVPEMVEQDYEAAVTLDRLTPHPANPNDGDLGLLCELFDANGFAGAVMAQKSTGILIDGETRWRAAHERGLKTLPVIWLDVTDDKRDRLLAEWNESTRRGRNDEAKLLALLTGLTSTPMGLTGTAFDGDDIDSLMGRLGKSFQITDAPTGAGYAETDEELAKRAAVNGGYRDRKEGGALVEMILVFTVPQREEVGHLLDGIRGAVGDKDARAADLVLQSLRVITAVLDSRMDDAQHIATHYVPEEAGEDAAEE